MIDPAQIRADHEKAMRSAPDEYSPEIVLTLLDAYERLLAAVTPSPAGLAGEHLQGVVRNALYRKLPIDIAADTCREVADEILTALTANGSQPDRVVDVLRCGDDTTLCKACSAPITELVQQPGCGGPVASYSINGSVYIGMEASIVRESDGRTVAHCPSYADAVELLATLDAKDQSHD